MRDMFISWLEKTLCANPKPNLPFSGLLAGFSESDQQNERLVGCLSFRLFQLL